MVSVKIAQRKNCTVKSISLQGFNGKNVGLAAATLVFACGQELETLKAGVIEISDEETIFVNDIKQSKPAMAVADAVTIGLEGLKKKYPYNIDILYLWEDE